MQNFSSLKTKIRILQNVKLSSTRTQYTGRIIGFTPMLKKREIRKERKKGKRIKKGRERNKVLKQEV